MARALAAAIAVSLLAVSGADGSAAQTPKRGGTLYLYWPSEQEPACLNAWARCGTVQAGLLEHVLLPPWRPGPRGWQEVLVSRATVTTKPFTVTYHIRPHARWSDGKPVTAGDFAFSYRMSLSHGTVGLPLSIGPSGRFRAVIRGVRVVNAKTLRVVYGSRRGDWRLYGITPLPRHVLAGKDLAPIWTNRIDNPATAAPIGNGPFLTGRWTKGRQLELLRNRRYWGRHVAYLDRVVFRFLSDPLAAFRAGEADVVPGSYEELRGRSDVSVLAHPGTGWEHFELRIAQGGHPALKNKLVRRALAYAIDREVLVRTLWRRFAPSLRRPRPLESTVFLASDAYYRPNWRIYDLRPAVARRLLRETGCRLGPDGIYSCAGERLSLRFATTAGNPIRASTLEITQAQLRRIGIEVVPVYAPARALFGTHLPQGDFDVALFQFINPYPEATSSTLRCGDRLNFSGYCSRLVTGDLNQLDLIVHPRRRAEVANRVDRRLARDVPVIPLYQVPGLQTVRRTIRGFVPNPYHPTWDLENWWLAR